jgi:hypothetical protein
MHLAPGERQILASDDGSLVLTDRRVRYDGRVGMDRRLIEIPLDAVTTRGLVQRTPGWTGWAALALVVFRERLELRPVEVAILVGMIGVDALILRGAVLEIHAAGGQSIRVSARRMRREDAIAFLDALDRARRATMAPPGLAPAEGTAATGAR